MAQRLGLPPAYGQKKVSQWEAGISKPNEKELVQLATALKIPHDEIGRYFTDPSAQPAVELSRRLATSTRPALFAMCFSGRPRIMADSFVRARFVEAMKRHL